MGVIRSCNGKMFEKAMRIFCENLDFHNALSVNRFSYSVDNIKDLVDILICRFLKGLSNGEIITIVSFRNYFVMKWIENDFY